MDGGDIEVPVEGEGQGARDGGRGHEQEVHGRGFTAQGGALAHAEAVLFVDDGQAQAGEGHIAFEQGVRAHHDVQLARARGLQGLLPLLGRHPGAEQGEAHPHAVQEALEGPHMLFGQDLGGGHEGGLGSVLDGEQHRGQGHHGLPGPHIPLEEARHGALGAHVLEYLVDDPFLGVGELEAQPLAHGGQQSPLDLVAVALGHLAGLPVLDGPGQLQQEQLVEGQAPAGLLELGSGAREVGGRDGLGQGEEFPLLEDLGGEGFAQAFDPGVQGAGHGLAQETLGEALGEGVDRDDASHMVGGLGVLDAVIFLDGDLPQLQGAGLGPAHDPEVGSGPDVALEGGEHVETAAGPLEPDRLDVLRIAGDLEVRHEDRQVESGVYGSDRGHAGAQDQRALSRGTVRGGLPPVLPGARQVPEQKVSYGGDF